MNKLHFLQKPLIILYFLSIVFLKENEKRKNKNKNKKQTLTMAGPPPIGVADRLHKESGVVRPPSDYLGVARRPPIFIGGG
jgi:hypothetical protein